MSGVLAGLVGSLIAPTGAFESIATATGTGSSNTITFSSIPSTYQHLQIRFIAKTTSTAGSDFALDMRFNSDSASNYPWHKLWGDGTTAQANGFAATTRIVLSSRIPDSFTSWANMFEVGVIDIHDYASTSKNKTARALLGKNINTAAAQDQEIALVSGLWMSTSAINSISLITTGSTNWTTTTQFALYGIKGA